MAEKLYTTGEAAKAAGISRQTLQTWIADGKIEAPKVVGNTRVWTKEQVEELKRQCTKLRKRQWDAAVLQHRTRPYPPKEG